MELPLCRKLYYSFCYTSSLCLGQLPIHKDGCNVGQPLYLGLCSSLTIRKQRVQHRMFAIVVLCCVASATSSGIHQPQPYKFGYSIKDHHGEQHREESGNGAGAVVGNYGFTDDRGIARQVNYVADHAGFRAQVKTNEPGTANQNPAAVQVISNDPYSRGAAQSYVSRPNEPLELSADPVLGLNAGYGYGVNGYGHGSGRNGLGYDYGVNGYGHGSGRNGFGYDYGVNGYGYGSGRNGLGYGYGANGYGYGSGRYGVEYGNLGYGHSLGYNVGYGGTVNYGAPLIGGVIRGYDSRFVNVA
ncbi:cuticle protein 16.8 [Caerostris darwini]|uniref:Cuticle protein 16.8 n=1 Tax=Caerostris darwini TaxID=1538125 RepID=A0AAV4VPM5_9ARAC|nr:cuticle protein 16.8 [Caerostris darwini]